MPDAASSSKAIQRASAQKTRVLLVRQPVKSVRRSDEPDRLPLRLLIGILAVIGGVASIWLIGHLGFRLGFASMLGVPELLAEPGAGLATGARILLSTPLQIFRAGVAEPLWLMLGFAMIAAPSAALAGVRPVTPGGPRPKPGYSFFCMTSAVVGLIAAALIIAYVVSPVRLRWFAPLPSGLSSFDAWERGLSIVAGMDVLLLTSGVIWVVLLFRLMLPVWMRALALAGTIFAVIVALVATGMSGATAAQLAAPRSMVTLPDESTSYLLLGYTREHTVLLWIQEDRTMIALQPADQSMRLSTRVSLEQFLETAAAPLANQP